MKIAIVGLGYVGLPLSLQFARSGVSVLGLDIDPAKVASLNQGRSYIKHIESSSIAEAVKAGSFAASTDFERIREVEAVIICVPTPLNKNREPDISYIIDTGMCIAPHLQKGMLVVLGIHDLSGHHGRGFAGGAGKRVGSEGGQGFSSGLFAGTGRPRQRAEQGGNHSQGDRRLHARLSGTGQGGVWQGHQDDCAGVLLPRGRGDQAAGKHFPQRQHRAGERTEGGLWRDGH